MKRNGLKKMVLGVAAGAMMLASMAMGASAATITAGHTYKVNANLYIPAEQNPVRKIDAYFTSESMPPMAGLSNQNATLVVDGSGDGTLTIELPLYDSTNGDGLSLITLGASSDISKCSSFSGTTEDVTCSGGHSFSRVKKITFTLPNVTSYNGTSETCTFGASSCHAKISLIKFAIYDGLISPSQVNLVVNYANSTQQTS